MNHQVQAATRPHFGLRRELELPNSLLRAARTVTGKSRAKAQGIEYLNQSDQRKQLCL